ncbi:MAG: aminotransferase class III-fold pyridoxal phosphate-dependent enzyme, partial [Bacteroidota bacterium]|nr:aminotransferase class III-fold pyridoxal phosphate-dependent enzyme [Bacteroidota bacterium]
VFSDGAGVVLLKSLKEAELDGDTIYSVIKGVGVNNDGAGKGSFTAPNAAGQAGAITLAINDAGLQPSDISFIEAHGTATPIGDPIEIEGLRLAFGQQEVNQYCALGSVKSNIGHLTAASGIAGFIKTTLSLFHKQIPATLFFSEANSAIDFANTPFYVNAELRDWNTRTKRRAGVSSFGVGGTNVHIVVEEYENKEVTPGESRPVQLLAWSAKSMVSAKSYGALLAQYLQQNQTQSLADVAYTLHTTRADFNHRYFAVVPTGEKSVEKLQQCIQLAEINTINRTPGEVVFMFPGQGSQYVNMGRELYQNEMVYRQAIDECASLLKPLINTDIRQAIFQEYLGSEDESIIHNTFYTQPALFITEYALAKLWMSWGIHPTILCGHSIGEIVVAQLAGVFSLADALQLIASRSKMASELPRGKMLSVRISLDSLLDVLPASLSIAAINSDDLFVLAGHEHDIVSFSKILNEKEIPNKLLATSHAFHSAMMDPIIPGLQAVVEQLALHPPKIRIMSTVTGTWLTDAEATDPQYWANHVRKTVRFGEALKSILKEESPLFLEVGPGNVTASLARKQAGKAIVVISSLDSKSTNEYHSVLTALARLWGRGVQPSWPSFYANERRKKLLLPSYSFDKKYCWINPPKAVKTIKEEPLTKPYPKELTSTLLSQPGGRKATLTKKITQIIEDASGIEIKDNTANLSFLEAGLDSLLLTQLALTLRKEFNLPISFRLLMEDCNTVDSLAAYLEINLRQYDSAAIAEVSMANAHSNGIATETAPYSPIDQLTRQLQVLTKRVEGLEGTQSVLKNKPAQSLDGDILKEAALTADELLQLKKPFGATPKIDRTGTDFNNNQKTFLEQLICRYNKKTQGSKNYTESNRPHMADPRVVSGFSPLTKELIYPIVANKSKGSRVWDVDGNEYIDVLNGFGSNLFGYQPDFLKKAIYDQVEKGFELGPQHELAGEVSKLICAFTNFDRAAFCNTGSEAVLGALRIARTVTGRSLIVAFSGSYHGINDEVIIRGTRKLKSFPAAPGIMAEAVQNMLILDYGTDEALQIIRERANELAAVLVEPVQSRRPEFRPVEFLKQVREITIQSNTVLIFDEVITGFRMHPGGAQAMFGVRADVATYGKVIGGGLPIGVIAGKKQFMDALDGGQWQYGDLSIPEVGVTYFAGTFVRHPLALATAKASLQYMRDKGPDLQTSINNKAAYLATTLNAELEQRELPFYIAQFGSLWKTKFKEEIPYYELMFTLMREKGIHIWDGFPCFMTEAHTNEDVKKIISVFIESVDEVIVAGFYKKAIDKSSVNRKRDFITADKMPSPAARLGRDKNGNPAWFMSHPEQPGKYLQIMTH